MNALLKVLSLIDISPLFCCDCKEVKDLDQDELRVLAESILKDKEN